MNWAKKILILGGSLLVMTGTVSAAEPRTELTVKTVVVAGTHFRVYFTETTTCGAWRALVIENTNPDYYKSALSVAMTAYVTKQKVSFYADDNGTSCHNSDYFSFAAGSIPGLF